MYQVSMIQVTREEIVSITCDRCQKAFDYKDDFHEFEEFHHIDFIGGYASVFGDGDQVQCDLCQRCLKELVGGFCRISCD